MISNSLEGVPTYAENSSQTISIRLRKLLHLANDLPVDLPAQPARSQSMKTPPREKRMRNRNMRVRWERETTQKSLTTDSENESTHYWLRIPARREERTEHSQPTSRLQFNKIRRRASREIITTRIKAPVRETKQAKPEDQPEERESEEEYSPVERAMPREQPWRIYPTYTGRQSNSDPQTYPVRRPT